MAITKTDFMRGMQCRKMLWLDKHRPSLRVIPPEVQAQIFWLKNRRPDLWRDKVENALVGAPDGEVTPRIVVEHIKSAMKEAERDAAPTK